MTKLVLTAIGDDKPGLVAALSQVLAEHDANWLESQMARLAGKFAGIVLVEVPPERVDSLSQAVGGLGVLNVSVLPVDDDGTPADGPTLHVHLLGHDRPGIVSQVTKVLATKGVSIDELTTDTFEAPMAGGQLFEADAIVRAPESMSADDLRAALEGVASELNVDLDVS